MTFNDPRPSRTFTDAQGETWTVVEVATPRMPPALKKLVGRERRTGGWLVFVNEQGQKRRLSPFPDDWRSVSDFEMERWCMRAALVPPAPERRAAD